MTNYDANKSYWIKEILRKYGGDNEELKKELLKLYPEFIEYLI